MQLQERIAEERMFHDRQARTRRAYFEDRPERLLVEEKAYLDHEPWIRPALAKLGDLRGRRVLDFGCGHGMAAVVLAKRGARVIAFDLSGGYLREARARARANCASVDFAQADGEWLPFPDETFDCIWGNAILHHLDMWRAGLELRRVLKPGGVAVFCEPWGGNPLLNWARGVLPYPHKERTPREKPLCHGDIEVLRGAFGDVEVEGYQLLSMIRRVVGGRWLVKVLAAIDSQILKWHGPSRKWCRYVVVTLRLK